MARLASTDRVAAGSIATTMAVGLRACLSRKRTCDTTGASHQAATILVADRRATALLGVVYAKQGRRQDANRILPR